MAGKKNVCVYCASSKEVGCIYFDAAERLAALLAGSGYGLVCGGGNEGLMNSVADSALAAGGEVVGIIPAFMKEKGWMHRGLTQSIVTPDIHTRKRQMASLSDAVVALPGGCGTMEELLEIITWKQLGLYDGLIVVLNVGGFYNPLLEMLHRAVDQHFMKSSHLSLWQVADTPEQAINLIATFRPERVEPKRP